MTIAVTACGRGAAGRPVDLARAVPLSHFGIDASGQRDQWSALKAAFEAAAHDRLALIAEPNAIYRHDGPLTLDGVSFDGRGCIFLALSDGPQVLRCVGRNWHLANLTVLGAATARDGDNQKNGLLVGDHAAAPADDFVIENVTVAGAGPGRGVAGAGMMFNNAHRGRISQVRVQDSKADGFHVTNGSSDLAFEQPVSERTGDDGFAVVSYRYQDRPCRHIRIQGGSFSDALGRGLSVVGGQDVIYARCDVARSAAAGAYFVSEPGYDTYGVDRCRIEGSTLDGCVTGKGQAPDFAHAVIMMGGRAGSDAVGTGTLPRAASDCTIVDVTVSGAGSGCFAAVSLNEFALRSRIERIDVRQLTALGATRQPNGIEIGGRDTRIDAPRLAGIPGTPFIITRSAAGSCTIDGAQVSGARLVSSKVDSFNAFCYVDDAPRLVTMVVSNGRFTNGPRRLVTNLLGGKRLRLTGNRLNGRAV